MRRWVPVLFAALFCTSVVTVVLRANPPSGAIFTTVEDGSEVNFNIYPSKEAVYLDGGPGPGAPQTAAGLDDGIYVFQVTDPSGKRLLSTDPAQCRQFEVTDGIITSVDPSGACAHNTGVDIDHGATTVQLMPYNDTPNPGGVYKVWATLASNYQCDLAVVDCGFKPGQNVHGFSPSDSKTDNFKVRAKVAQEIDARFFADTNGNNYHDDGEQWLDGIQIKWHDTVGGSNHKSSYYNASLNVNHEAHIEAPEDGTHRISISDQPGCTVGWIAVNSIRQPEPGPQTVEVVFPKTAKALTIFVDVQCVQ
jgi:hypothetical protein